MKNRKRLIEVLREQGWDTTDDEILQLSEGTSSRALEDLGTTIVDDINKVFSWLRGRE